MGQGEECDGDTGKPSDLAEADDCVSSLQLLPVLWEQLGFKRRFESIASGGFDIFNPQFWAGQLIATVVELVTRHWSSETCFSRPELL